MDIIELYSDHLAVHLNASKERILNEYKKMHELEERPRARVTCPLEAAPAAAITHAHPAHSKNFGERAQCLLNERSDAAASTDDTHMVIVENRLAEAEPPPQTDTFVKSAFYNKLKSTLRVIFVSGWGVFIQEYQFNELDDRTLKLKKGQNVNNFSEETAL